MTKLDARGVVVVGDLHYSDRIYKKLPGMRGDAEFALEQIMAFAVENASEVWFLGDVFDETRPPASVVDSFLRYTTNFCDADSRGSAAGILRFLQGQHDWQDVPWGMVGQGSRQFMSNWGEGLLHVSTALGPTWGMDYTPRIALADRLSHIDKEAEVLVCHQTAKEVCNIGNEEDLQLRRWDFSFEEVPETIKLILAGDWHDAVEGTVHNGKTKWIYTGSCTMRSVSEPRPKSFLHVSRQKDDFVIHRIPLRTRAMLPITAEYEHELREKLREIAEVIGKPDVTLPEPLQSPLVVVRHASDLQNAAAIIREELGSFLERGVAHLHTLTIPRAGRSELAEAEVSGQAISLNEAVSQLVDPELAPDLHRLVLTLADTMDPEQVLQGVRERSGLGDLVRI